MDPQNLSGVYAIVVAVAGVFLLILAILWILVPFAVFGIKPLLRTMVEEERRTQNLLASLSQQLHNMAVSAPVVERPVAETVVDRPAQTTVVERPIVDPPPRY